MMKLSFKTSRFLMTSFEALTLVGSIGSAMGCAPLIEEHPPEVTRQAVTAAAIQHNEEIMGAFFVLPDELILPILMRINPEDLSQMARTSSGLRRLVKDEVFQRQYQYEDIVTNQVPAIFGDDYVPQVLAFLADKPMRTYLPLLVRLLEPDNLAVLQANENALLKEIFAAEIAGTDGAEQPTDIAKILTIASYADQFFTVGKDEWERSSLTKVLTTMLVPEQIAEIGIHAPQLFTAGMTGYDRSQISLNLALFNHEQIVAVGTHAAQFFTAGMEESHRTRIIKALAPLSPEQIAGFAQALTDHEEQLFTAGMGRDSRSKIIKALASLSPDQIAAVSTCFEERESREGRIMKIQDYIQGLKGARKLMSQHVDQAEGNDAPA